jgi:hypothetical protein
MGGKRQPVWVSVTPCALLAARMLMTWDRDLWLALGSPRLLDLIRDMYDSIARESGSDERKRALASIEPVGRQLRRRIAEGDPTQGIVS